MTSPSTDRRFGVNSSMAIKVPCKVMLTSSATTLTGEKTIDGASCVTGDRVVRNVSPADSNNGIWVVDSGSWSRATDFDDRRDVTQGTLITVLQGNTYAFTAWRVATSGTITPGTTSIAFQQAIFSSAEVLSFIQAGVGAVERTVQDELRETFKVTQFDAVGDGVADDLAAFNKALAAIPNNGVLHLIPGKTYRLSGPWTFSPTSSRITIEGNGAIIHADHNGDGIVLTSSNENYGGHVLRNLTVKGPNVAYPMSAGELAGTSTGAGVKMGGDNSNSPSGYANEFHNCEFRQFRIGVYMQAALWCKFFGGSARYNQYGIMIDGGQTNANSFYGFLVRENRVRGLYSTGSTAGALSNATANAFYGGGFETNIPYRGDNPAGYSGGYPTAMDVTGTGVAVFLTNSYDFVFDGAYFENHNYSMWINGSSDNNSATHCRFAPSGPRIGGVLLDTTGTSFNTWFRCTMIGSSSTVANVETFNANQFNNQFLDCEGFTFIDANLVSKPYVRNNRTNQAGGGTIVGAITMPTQGYVSNPGEGTTAGTISGIGTATATLNVGGFGEIELGSLITANTTITTISGMMKGQFLTLRNYQTAHTVKLVSDTAGTGSIVLKNRRTATMVNYGDEIVLYCNSQGKVYEVGRNFSDRVFGSSQISGASTSVAVTFANAEPDNNYVPMVAVSDLTGAPAAGAWDVRTGSQSVNGFTISVQAAPGVGNSFFYNWEAVR